MAGSRDASEVFAEAFLLSSKRLRASSGKPLRVSARFRRAADQNVTVSSSAIITTGGPPFEILAAWARASWPAFEAAQA